MKRRANGEGSIYERSNGRFVGEWEDALGKRRYVSGKSKADVRAKLKEKLKEKEEGIAVEGNLTVEKYLDQWLDSVKDTLRPGAFRRYEESSRIHIKPELGKVKLSRLNALQLQSLYRKKLDEGLSARTVQIIHATLHKSLKQAVRWSVAARNVAEGVTPPRPAKKEIQPLTRDQIKALLNTAEGDRLYTLWVLLATTAMRNGEALALQWKDIDLQAGKLQVRRTIFNGEINPPKTSAGKRTIRLSKLAIAALKQHRTRQAQERISEWVFSTSEGTPISVHNVHNRYWRPLLERAGLPATTRMHDLRHSCISLLLGQGVPIKVISEMAGHADVSTTLSVYGHTLPDMQDQAVDGIDQALG